MGGSGGGSWVGNRNPSELAKQVRRSEESSADSSFDVKLADDLARLLANYNGRDVPLVRERLEKAKEALEHSIEGTVDQVFGGSVAKHTYVDGLSDVDSLVVINGTVLAERTPQGALSEITRVLEARLTKDEVVKKGRMAVTIDYADGMSIQLLPAIREADGRLRVPSSRREGEWSLINPDAFRQALSRRNVECGNKLVPVIKLAKAINGTLPEAQQLSGYHVESLAIAAFRGYDGQKSTSTMLPIFFERSRDLIRSPIRDSTGQSVHVDDYMGPADSPMRLAASHVLGAIAKRMRNAKAAGSLQRWRSLFGADD